MTLLRSCRAASVFLVCFLLAILLGASSLLFGVCGPFTDVTDAAFCPFVLEIFTLGITTGTTATTYEPTSSVSRLQMAAFLSRTVDGTLRRGSRRAALRWFSSPQNSGAVDLTTVGAGPFFCRSDGADVWTANQTGNSISRVRGSDGKLLETWTGANLASGILVAMGRVFATGTLGVGGPFALYAIDPSQAAGAVTVVTSALPASPFGLTFDGARVWTANFNGSVSIVTPGTIPWTVTTVGTGFTQPIGAVYDGTNVWVTDQLANRLFRLDSAGAILQAVTTGPSPQFPVFDGANIWVPNLNGSFDAVTVIRASNGAILRTLTGNGLGGPNSAAFDGQRILIANGAGSVSLWKAADLTPLGSVGTGPVSPFGACSDGLHFWVTYTGSNQLARF